MIPDGSLGSDPVAILRGICEELVAACATGTVTEEQIDAFRRAMEAFEPEAFAMARALIPGSPYLYRRTLRAAEATIRMLDAAAPATSRRGGAR